MKKQKPALTQPPSADGNEPKDKEAPPSSEEHASTQAESSARDAGSQSRQPAELAENASSDADASAATGKDGASRSTGNKEQASKDRPAQASGSGGTDPAGEKRSDGSAGNAGASAGKASRAGSTGGGKGGPPTSESTPPRKSGHVPALVISVIALLAVAFLGWQVFELRHNARETRQEVAERLSENNSRVGEMRGLTGRNRDAIESIQQRFGALESKIETTEGQAAALESLYQEFTRTRSDRVLAEVEQAVNIAAQQLQLAGNFESALIALQGAEARLAAPEYSHFRNLRRALLSDIDAIKAHPQVDVSGMALRMENILESVDGLPLAHEDELSESSAAMDMDEGVATETEDEQVRDGALSRSLAFTRAFAADVWNELSTMVRLERMDQSAPVLLAPKQSAYLRENVKVRLLTARLALLARDNRTYQADVAQAREWIERYFDVGDENVQRVLSDLADLAETEIRTDPPDLTETFSALRMARSRVPDDAPAGADRDADAR